MDKVNKQELRRLAEAAIAGDWFDGGDLRYSDDKTGEVHGLNVEDERFISAANPAAILSLLDENKRIANRLCACRDCGGQGEIYSGHDSYQGHFQPPEPVMDVCGTCGGDGVLGPLEDFEALAEERDQLRAELEQYRKLIAPFAAYMAARRTSRNLSMSISAGSDVHAKITESDWAALLDLTKEGGANG